MGARRSTTGCRPTCRGVVPVGRLDLNTEGLLLLTTDGELKRQLELPATGVERAYRARAYGQVSQAQLEDLIEGVEIEGVRYGSINANLERRTGANVWIEMILTEGKNREVRRVLEYLGLKVSRLIRTRYGPFVLGDLPVGEVGEVRQHDVVAFRKNPTKKPAARARGAAAAARRPLPAGAGQPCGAPRVRPAPAETGRTARVIARPSLADSRTQGQGARAAHHARDGRERRPRRLHRHGAQARSRGRRRTHDLVAARQPDRRGEGPPRLDRRRPAPETLLRRQARSRGARRRGRRCQTRPRR